MSIEQAFQKHLDDHKKDDKEKLLEERKLYREIMNIKMSVDNLPLILKETFITRAELNNGLCSSNFKTFIEEYEKEKKESGKCKEDFNHLIKEYKEEQIKNSNQFLTLLKNIGWSIATIIGSVSIIGSGIIDKLTK